MMVSVLKSPYGLILPDGEHDSHQHFALPVFNGFLYTAQR
jgi:hypothetical protein